MEKENKTLWTEFVLTGLTCQPQWKILLFLVFLVIYFMTIMGNLGLITLIWNDPRLHIPMYLFLSNLAFVDTWLSSTMTPKMLLNIFAKSKLISLSECMIQVFFSICNQCNHRMLSLGSNGVQSLHSHMQTLTPPSDYGEQTVYAY